MKSFRLIIYPKDIALLLGKSPRQARRIMNEIKHSYNKQKHHLVTIDEFCRYYNIPFDEVIKMLRY